MTPHLWLGHPLTCALLISTLSLFGGCDAEEFSIQLMGVKAIDPTSCTPIGDESSLLSQGTIDLVLAQDYVINLSMRNRLSNSLEVNMLNEDEGHLNTTDVTLKSAVIRYLDPDEVGFGLGEDERVVAFGGLLPSGNLDPITRTLSILTPEMTNNLRQNGAFKGLNSAARIGVVRNSLSMIISVRVQGETLDGKRVESNEVTFPIEICTGCRISTRGRSDECMLATGEQDLLTLCPSTIGRDQVFASCGLCQQTAVDETFVGLCTP